MKLMHFNITLIILLLCAYCIGARWPALAKMAKVA